MPPFTICFPRSAPRQWALLSQISSVHCTLNAVNSSAIISGIYDVNKRVPDVFRYVLNINGQGVVTQRPGGGSLACFNDHLATNSSRGRILLLLESPHQYEYDQSFTPQAPAQGDTGARIHDQLCALLERHAVLMLPPGDYDLIIANPVQFQASLFCLHGQSLFSNSAARGLRDKAWRALFSIPAEHTRFRRRLNTYAPVATIIACTSHLQRDVVNDVLDWALQSNGRGNIFSCNSHPSLWSSNTTLEHLI